MEAQNYEIRVIKSKKDDKHNPVEPRTLSNGNKSYIIGLKVLMQNINGCASRAQTEKFVQAVYNNGGQAIFFEDLEEALANPDNYITLSNGDLLVKKQVLTRYGVIKKVKTGFSYRLTTVDEKGNVIDLVKNQGANAGQVATRSSVSFFVASNEDEDVREMEEVDRLRKYELEDTKENEIPEDAQ